MLRFFWVNGLLGNRRELAKCTLRLGVYPLIRSWLHHVEVFYWRVPVDGEWFSAVRISANDFLLFHFARETGYYGFFEGVHVMPIVGGFSFKSAVAVGAS